MKIKKNFKKILIAVFLSAMIFSMGCAQEDQTTANGEKIYKLRFAHSVNARTPKGQAAELFKELIEERSEGRIVVDVYPDSQMGSDQGINELIISGTVDIGTPLVATMTSFTSQFELFDLPYLFESFDQASAALNGDLGAEFDKYLDEKGFESLGYMTGGFKQITNSKRPIKSVKDLEGLKIRVTQSPLLVTQFQALKAGGISVPFSELYSGLQTKTVDGQENPYSNIATRKFYEVQDYMTISDHGLMAYAFFMNQEKFDSLPEDLQDLVKEVSREVVEWEWAEVQKTDAEYLQEIKDFGVTIDEFGEKEKEEFIEATGVAFEEFAQMEDGQRLLDIAAKYTNN